jgi:hypothetical protein
MEGGVLSFFIVVVVLLGIAVIAAFAQRLSDCAPDDLLMRRFAALQ